MKKVILCMMLAVCALCLSSCVGVNNSTDGVDIAGILEVDMLMNSNADTAFRAADTLKLDGEAEFYVFEKKDSDDPVLVKNATEITVAFWGMHALPINNVSVPNIQIEIPYENLEYNTGYFLDLSGLCIQLLKDGENIGTFPAIEFSTDTSTFTTKAAPSGNKPDGNEPDSNEPDGNEPDGNEPDGNEPDGNEPDGNEPDGNEPDGNEPDGNEPDSNEPDGNEPDSNKPDGNEPDGDKPEANQPGSDNIGSKENESDQLAPEEPESNPPVTGDKSNIMLWMVLATVSLMGIMYIKKEA